MSTLETVFYQRPKTASFPLTRRFQTVPQKKTITPIQRDELLAVLMDRFTKNESRHEGIAWEIVVSRLNASPEKWWSLMEMERTGGEPDVVGLEEVTGEILFFDCAPESPAGRRSLCYDDAALEARKKFKPEGSAVGMATEMGIDLLTEKQYQKLQELGPVDTKTSSWLQTPPSLRELGGAIFGDFRFNRVFIYHNGVESYYAARGFRGCLKV